MTEKTSRNLCKTINNKLVFLIIFLNSPCVQSWDLAVATDSELSLFSVETPFVTKPLASHNIAGLYALAFDPSSEKFYFSISHNQPETIPAPNASIYSYDMKTKSLESVVPLQNFEVQGIAFDPQEGVLFWTDGVGHTVWFMSTREPQPDPKAFLVLPDERPVGITISLCKRKLFWANSYHRNASLDVSNLDGSFHKQLVTKDVFQPTGVTVDEQQGKLYWTDDHEGIYYRIERCDLDGSDREVLVRRQNQEPFSIAVFDDAVFWTDIVQNKIFTISTGLSFPNSTKAKLLPDIFYQFKGIQPNGLVAFRNATVQCDVVRTTAVTPVNIVSDEPQEDDELSTDVCLNSGDLVGGICRCKRGFAGKRCEISMCYNFCLNGGQCFLDKAGYPECRCFPGYEGQRCDRDVCEGFCLNGGRCFINESSPLCSCAEVYGGQRCELSAVPECLCGNSTQMGALGLPCHQDMFIIIGLSSVSGLLTIILVILARKVCVLNRRPRLKKRYIVNKTVRSQTPLTSRPPSSADQCEITIENCCNMNICETPCFEPNLRTARSDSHHKTEDKKNLLRNMEEDS